MSRPREPDRKSLTVCWCVCILWCCGQAQPPPIATAMPASRRHAHVGRVSRSQPSGSPRPRRQGAAGRREGGDPATGKQAARAAPRMPRLRPSEADAIFMKMWPASLSNGTPCRAIAPRRGEKRPKSRTSSRARRSRPFGRDRRRCHARLERSGNSGDHQAGRHRPARRRQ